jgi:hypothetical protein
MKKSCVSVFYLFLFLTLGVFSLYAQSETPTPLTGEDSSLAVGKEKLEIERLKLENDKLKLEMDKMQFQATQTAIPKPETESKKSATSEEIRAYQDDCSRKAEALAKENKDKENLLVLDLANSEVWNEGVRFNIHEIVALAQERGWKTVKQLEERSPSGYGRYSYQIRNVKFLKYEDQTRGVLEIQTPKEPSDFDVVTIDGITFGSSSGVVRNVFRNVYFNYEGEESRDRFKVLKFGHGRGLDFGDELEFHFERNGKLVKIRYGVLEVH